MQPPPNPSLSCNLEQGVELVYFIAALNSLDPKEIRDIPTMKKKVLEEFAKPEFAKRAEQTRDLLGRLIFHQFPNIPVAASCELLSNSRDAQVRAKRESKPIILNVQKNNLDLFDHGDGMDATGLATFLSIGRSSNPEALYNLDKGIPNVTGRYGHGAVSIYYYLAYDWLEKTATFPAFQVDREALSLTIHYENKGNRYEAHFSILFKDGKIEVDVKPIEKGRQDKKIRIVTGKGEEAYKMVFKEADRSIFVKIKPLHERHEGTAIHVSSPLVEVKKRKIAEQTEKTFRFVTRTPIEINGRGINPPSRYQKFSFDGVTLLYAPKTHVKGSVAICENGRIVQEYASAEGTEIPMEMAVSFDKLPLTSDRAIVHFEDPKTVEKMRRMVHGIFTHPSLSLHEKALLLNGLYPLLKADRFHLLKEVRLEVSKWVQTYQRDGFRFVPDTQGLRSLKIEKAVHLHPELLDEIKLPPYYAKGPRALYAVPIHKQGKVAETCSAGPMISLFLDQDFIRPEYPLSSYFHLHLLQHWNANRTAKHPDKGLFLDREWLKTTFLPKRAAAVEIMQTLSLEKFENLEGANEAVPSSYFHQMVEEKAKGLFPEKRQEVLQWLHYFKLVRDDRLVKKKFYHYLFQALLSQPPLKGTALHASQIGILLATFKDLHSFSTWYRAITKLEGDVTLDDYPTRSKFLYAVQLINKACQQGIKITEEWLEDQYCRRMALYKKAQVPENQVPALFNHFYQESFDLLEALVDKIAHPALKALPLTGLGCDSLSDLTALLAMPSDTLTELLCLLPRRRNEFAFSWTAEDYRFIETSILPLRCDNKAKTKWIEVYQTARQILASSLPLQRLLGYTFDWNSAAFSQLLSQHATENTTLQYATAIHNDLRKAHSQLRNFAKSCEAVLPHVPQSYIEQPAPDPAVAPLPGYKSKQESIEAIGKFLDLLFPAPKPSGLREWIIKSWENARLIPDLARPFLYAPLMGDDGFLRSTNYHFNGTCKGKPVLLHEDSDVKGALGNSQVAKAALEEAVRQGRATPQFWLVELIKNSLEANAENIIFNVHTTKEGSIVVVVEDNGSGMTSEMKKKCKIPGKTTKRTDLDDPNFGIGWKSALADFKKIRFTTSTGGQTAEVLLFTNTKDGIVVQEETLEGDFQAGTKIEMIKEPTPFPLVDFIQMKSRCISRARHIQGIDIFFQDHVVNVPESVDPKICITEPLFVKGSEVGQATIHIGLWDEGLYNKNIKISQLIPEVYFDLLPEVLQQALQNDGARLRIFLPAQGEVLNRSLLTDEESILPQVQKLVLEAACDYLAASWLEGKHLNLLSNEYWYMYEVPEMTSTKSIEALYAKEDQHAALKQQLVNYIQNHFKGMPGAHFPYTCLSDKSDLEQLVANILGDDRANRKGESVKQRLDNPRAFLKFARRCPLQPDGLTLDALCLKIKTSLMAKSILTANDYNIAFIASKDLSELIGLLDGSLKQLSDELGRSYDPLLSMFRQQTLGKLTNIKKEQSCGFAIPAELLASLSHFMKSASKTYLNKEIEVRFDIDPSGHPAHTQKGTNILWINRNSQLMKRLVSAYDTIAASGTGGLKSELVPLAADWLELLAHEATHMEDNSDCCNLHDAQFYHQTACLIESMFTKPDSGIPNGYELFVGSLNPKKRKLV